MSPEDPITNEKQESQKQLIETIQNGLHSDNTQVKFASITMIPRVKDMGIRSQLESIAYTVISKTLMSNDYISPYAIDTAIRAIKCIDCLSGNLKNHALKQASEAYGNFMNTYKYFKNRCEENPNEESSKYCMEEIERFFIAVDGHKPNILKKKARQILTESISIDASVFGEKKNETENVEHRSAQEKAEWALYLLQTNSWPNIADGIKLFHDIADDEKTELSESIVKIIEQKILELLTLGLTCKETELEDRLYEDERGIKHRYSPNRPPLERNALYANLMALDLINYAPKKFKGVLIDIAEKNINMEDIAKEKLRELKSSL